MGNSAASFARRVVALVVALALVASCFLCSCTFEINISTNTNTAQGNTVKQSGDVDYKFRSSSLLKSHYEKHGKEMGFKDAKSYEAAASDVVNNPQSLHKLEKEDNDDVYYLESTNDFVIVSTDGYIRTYYRPDNGKSYFDRQ